MSDKERVKVRIETIHKTDEGNFPIIKDANGTYKKIDDMHYLTYEYMDEECASRIKCLIKCNEKFAEVIGDGDNKYKLLFDRDVDHISKVDMGGYVLSLKQHTNHISILESEDKVVVTINYELYQGDDMTSACDMKIHILRRIQ